MTSVFVSGANGFIAQHIVKQLLENNYKVIGSVRSEAKGEELKSLVNHENISYEVVPSLTEKGAFDDALKKHGEVTVFLHTASPFSFSVDDVEKDLMKPAIQGTLNVLNAIKEHAPQINKLVITSSAATNFGFGPHFDGEKVYTEDTWNPITYEESLENSFLGYFGSKKFAELSVHDFIAKHNVNFDVCFINPPYVFGPQAYNVKDKSNLNLSNEVINGLLKLKFHEKIPEEGTVFVDVRDVAKAHLIAIENEEAVGQRLLIISGKYTLDMIANIIARYFPSYFGPKGDEFRNEQIFKTVHKYDNSKTNRILGLEYITLTETVFDTVEQIYNTYAYF